jgi:hypothetical protein
VIERQSVGIVAVFADQPARVPIVNLLIGDVAEEQITALAEHGASVNVKPVATRLMAAFLSLTARIFSTWLEHYDPTLGEPALGRSGVRMVNSGVSIRLPPW